MDEATSKLQTDPCEVEATPGPTTAASASALQTDPCEVEARALGRLPTRSWLQTDPCEVEAVTRSLGNLVEEGYRRTLVRLKPRRLRERAIAAVGYRRTLVRLKRVLVVGRRGE